MFQETNHALKKKTKMIVGDATLFENRKYLRYPPILLNYFSSQVGKQIKPLISNRKGSSQVEI